MAITQVVVPRSGVFGVTRHRDRVVAEPNTGVLLEEGSTYSVDHPSSRGDRCTVLVFDREVLDQALEDGRPDSMRLSSRTQFMAHCLAHISPHVDDLDREEAALILLEALSADVRGCLVQVRLGDLQRTRVRDVCAILASRPEGPWRLAAIAKEVHVSPYHLARQFHAATGTTLGGYILRLRLSAALERLAEGDRSLSSIAAETGFAHHSHLTERFRSVFGITPSETRDARARGRLREIAKLVTTASRQQR